MQVSALTCAPRCWAASISAAAAAQVTCTTNSDAPVYSRQPRRAAGRLGLDELRARERVVDRRRVPARERALDQQVDDVAVLGVDHDQPAEVAGALHRRRELVVADHQLALVGHEQLERADARLGHQLHVVERGLRWRS